MPPAMNLLVAALKIVLFPIRLLFRLLIVVATAVLIGAAGGLGGLGAKRKVKNVKRTDPSGWVSQQR